MENNRFIKYYDIAGIRFSVETDTVYKNSFPYSIFLTEEKNSEIRYIFAEKDKLPAEDGVLLYKNSYIKMVEKDGIQYRFVSCHSELDSYACTCFRKDLSDIPVLLTSSAPKIWDGMIFESLGFEHLLNQNHRMILHAAYFCVRDEAILFTAPSGTGKTTQAKLWEKYRNAEIINGDRACLSVESETVIAHGIPMAGTSKVCKNRSMPVRAIVVLEQAKENTVEYLTGKRAFQKLYSETWVNDWNHEDVANVVDLISTIIEKVPILLLKCLPDYSAVELLEKYIF